MYDISNLRVNFNAIPYQTIGLRCHNSEYYPSIESVSLVKLTDSSSRRWTS